jgi:aryl-alcohol dehydrogenase-like predicted oxidoreductase
MNNPTMDGLMTDGALLAVDRLRPIAAQAGVSLAQLALAWVLRRSEVASAIIGASRPQQVFDNATAAGIELSQETLTAIGEALGDAPVRKPTLATFARAGVKHRS